MNVNLVIFFILSINMFIVVYLLTVRYFTKVKMQKRLFQYSKKNIKEKNKSAGTIIYPLITKLKNKLVKLAPNKIKENLQTVLVMSESKLTVGDFILLKILLFLISIVIDILLFKNNYNRLNNLAFSIVISLTLFIMPDFLLKRKAKLRQKSIKRALPAFIDYLTISVEAGLGLDSAIYRVIKHVKGPLAEEIAYTMTEIKFGKTKKEAFKNLSNKANISEFTVFLIALVNGEELGISLSSILRIQAEQLRQKRKQQIQEAAYKLSIKLLFPLVFFILPSLFIIILGPAIIKMYTIFMK